MEHRQTKKWSSVSRESHSRALVHAGKRRRRGSRPCDHRRSLGRNVEDVARMRIDRLGSDPGPVDVDVCRLT